jgi:endonuclease YncB( thermonuclease family)
MKPISIAALVVVPFVLFIAAGLVYQSQTGSDIVTGEKTGLAAREVGEEQFESIYKNEPAVQSNTDFDSHRCIGEAKCVSELITEIIDGDTIYTANYKIRLSLVDTPEINEPGYLEASTFTTRMCPVGSFATIDQDDLQLYDQYDRLLANVFCNGKSLNSGLVYNGHAEISTRYCDTSEFSDTKWAQRFGCHMESENTVETATEIIENP